MKCFSCAHFLGMNWSGKRVRCRERGTRHARANKCKWFDLALEEQKGGATDSKQQNKGKV